MSEFTFYIADISPVLPIKHRIGYIHPSWTITLSRLGPYSLTNWQALGLSRFQRLWVAGHEIFAHANVRVCMPFEEKLTLCAPELLAIMRFFSVDFAVQCTRKAFNSPHLNPEYALCHLLNECHPS